MRSRRPQSKRKKRRQAKLWTPPRDWGPWLWGLSALNVLLGLYLSPATALQRLRIEGAPDYDRTRLASFVRGLERTPYLRTNSDRFQGAVLQNPAVESASYQANLFGRGVLRVVYKRPVAAVAEAPGVYLSSGGALFASPTAPALRITVEPSFPVGKRNLALFVGWRSGEAARMCENVVERLPDRDWRLVVSDGGFVSLVPVEGATIEFGSFDDLDKKFEALDRVLKGEPDLLARAKEVNLSSPSSPAVRR